jgi:transglutaminase-like putative cysteine protease
MRIRIWHDTIYNYSWPVTGVIQTLRLTPRNTEGQYVMGWRIDVSADCPLTCHVDAFGNVTHTLTADGPLNRLVVHVEGEAEIEDTNGVVKGTMEPFPPSLFLRNTAHAGERRDPGLRARRRRPSSTGAAVEAARIA